jgi:hypothetical protein
MRILPYILVVACSGTPTIDIPREDTGGGPMPTGMTTAPLPMPTGTAPSCDPKACPGVDGPCSERVCESGRCALRNRAAGTALSDPKAGDCKGAQCDGAGNVAAVLDERDAPVGGSCAGCTKASECPGADDDCKLRACVTGKCGFAFTPAGTVAATQAPGDCKKKVCDGAGNTQALADTSDVPNDNNGCTTDGCSAAGMPTYTPVVFGTTCATGTCNAVGMCVECNVADDCPGMDSFCARRACVASRCVADNTAAGTPTPGQVPEDCMQRQCNGTGGVKIVPFDLDVEFDGNQCTKDFCVGGVPQHPNEPAGTACRGTAGARVCNGMGTCVRR